MYRFTLKYESSLRQKSNFDEVDCCNGFWKTIVSATWLIFIWDAKSMRKVALNNDTIWCRTSLYLSADVSNNQTRNTGAGEGGGGDTRPCARWCACTQAVCMDLYNVISTVHRSNFQQIFHFQIIISTEITHITQQEKTQFWCHLKVFCVYFSSLQSLILTHDRLSKLKTLPSRMRSAVYYPPPPPR